MSRVKFLSPLNIDFVKITFDFLEIVKDFIQKTGRCKKNLIIVLPSIFQAKLR